LFVQLNEAGTNLLAFDPEPYCHVQLGHIDLKESRG
jgi:hypothetical protein